MSRNVAIVDGYVFFLSNEDGSVPERGGLFARDTRFLSRFDVTCRGKALKRLSSETTAPNRQFVRFAEGFSSVNEISETGSDKRSGTVLTRDRSVSRHGQFRDRISLRNHSSEPIEETLRIDFAADFADMFEVRGVDDVVDRDIAVATADDWVRYGYDFEDATGTEIGYETTVSFDPEPDALTAEGARYTVGVGAQEARTVTVTVTADIVGPTTDTLGSGPDITIPEITSSHPEHARTLRRAKSDLKALTAGSSHGPVVLAGAPWFVTVFGRDSLLTSFQLLPVCPDVAAGVLSYLAAHQADAVDASRLAEPGKILHEIRHGELARRGRIRYDPFYGTIDATALWIVVLDEYYRWTADEETLSALASALTAAVEWLTEKVTDGDDPFVYYRHSSERQLTHTAWKDSEMSVQFADGTRASPPLASVEVQGYAYDALDRAAGLFAGPLDDHDRAEELDDLVSRLRTAFDDAFWLPDREYFAAALTGDGRRVDALTSNVGQCLWSGIIDQERADQVVERLFSEDLYSGWGIRSMSAADAGYSPVSYHIGSVWPHDNSLIALGLARYGYNDRVVRLTTDLLDAVARWQSNRFPEVFCGFSDATDPARYPASCEPQAWGAGSPYALIRAALDIPPPGPSPPVHPDSAIGLTDDITDLFSPATGPVRPDT